MKNFVAYVHDSWKELKKVTWLTQPQTVQYTIIVIGVCLFSMIFLAIFDAIFSWGYLQIANWAQSQGGLF